MNDVAGCCRMISCWGKYHLNSFERFFIAGIVSVQMSYASNAPSINQVLLFCLHTFHTLAIFSYIHIFGCLEIIQPSPLTTLTSPWHSKFLAVEDLAESENQAHELREQSRQDLQDACHATKRDVKGEKATRNLKITKFEKGKSSEPNLHDFGSMLIFQGVGFF